MTHIAIVEDQIPDQEKLRDFLDRFEKENSISFSIEVFSSASQFLATPKIDFDILFMDIEMPGINGFDASVKFREKDTKTVLIFITNLNQYAIKGYSVNAFDYINKPINYFSFSTMLQRAIKKANFNRKSEIVINTNNSIIKVDISEIKYIEVINHKLIYHLDKEDVVSWQSLSSIKGIFLEKGFALASASMLINLRCVHSLTQGMIILNDEKKTQLYLSRSQKKEFALAFSEYIMGD